MERLIKYLALALLLGLTAPVQAYHYPWDQAHDIFKWDDPPPPGTCEDGECEGDECDQNTKKSPVYIQTGQFNWIDSDITLPGHPALRITRSYQSNDPRDGLFGNGWSFEHDKMLLRVRDTSSGTERFRMIMRRPNGKRYAFDENGDGTCTSPRGVFRTVQKQSDGIFRLESKNGAYEQYAYGRLMETADQNGNKLSYTYGSAGNLTRVQADGGRHLDFSYHSNGRVSTIVDHTGRTWRYDYDVNGNLTSVTNPLGGVRQYQYKAYTPLGDGHTYYLLTRVTDEAGVVLTQVTYTGAKVASYTEGSNTWKYTYNTTSRITTKTNSLGHKWTFQYNEDGLSIQDTNPLGHKVTVTRDSNGLATKTVDPAGHAWLAEWDEHGRRLSTTNPLGAKTTYEYSGTSPWPVKVTSPTGRVTQVTYDAKGNPLTITDPAGAVSRLEWNAKGDFVASVDALNNRAESVPNALGLPVQIMDALGRTTFLQYDALGQLTQVTNAAGETSHLEYDALGRVVASTNAAGHTVRYAYDASGRLVTLSDPKGQSWRYDYDSYGRVVRETTPDGRATTYAYATDNRLKTETRPDGSTVTYGYDAAGRLTSKTAGGVSTTFTYDARGLLTQAKNTAATVIRQYDVVGQLVAETVNGRAIQNAYNAEGERIRLTAAGRTVDYHRDLRGLIDQLTAQGTLDFDYDALGRLTGFTRPNGLSTSHTLDAASQLTAINHSGVMSLTYSHDAAGRITRKSGNQDDWNYQYDAAERLIQATGLASSHNYQYDALGNRLENGGIYDTANRLNEDAAYKYAFDARGNLTQKLNKTTGEWDTYGYNGENRLVRFERYAAGDAAPFTVATYAYDPLGRRIQKSVNGQITQFQWDGTNLIAEYDHSELVKRRYYFGSWYAPLRVEDATGTYEVHTDHLDSPQYLTNEHGNVVWQAAFEPFGEVVIDDDVDGDGAPVSFNFRFPGQYEDTESGFFYNYFRDYDPTTGRYISHDPLGVLPGLTPTPNLPKEISDYYQSFTTQQIVAFGFNHPFAYVENNPLRFVDPFGLYGTASCAYYSQACERSGGYACAAQHICPVFPEGEKNGWWQCVRQCLQEEHSRREGAENSCPVTDNPYTDHTTCFLACAINSGNPGMPSGTPPRP